MTRDDSFKSEPIGAAFVALTVDAPVVAFIKDPAGRYVYANRYLIAAVFEQVAPDWYGKTDADFWPPLLARVIRANDEIAIRSGAMGVFAQEMPFVDGSHSLLMMKFPLTAQDRRTYLGGIGVDQTALTRIDDERDRLAAAVEQVAESVIISDLEGRITYVNPAFERITGYSRDEVIGQNSRILNSGIQSATFYDAMWASLTNGLPWIADFVNRRKDGTLFTEESVISPIRDAAGAIAAYVAVKRDVTRERAVEVRSVAIAHERAVIAETIRGLTIRDTTETTARAICSQVLSLSGIVSAQLFIFELDGRAMPLAMTVAGAPDPVLRRLPDGRSAYLRGRAAGGPWIEPWEIQPAHPYNDLLSGLGIHLAAYAPLRYGGHVIGLLVIDGAASVDEPALTETLPALVEFADLAAALLGSEVLNRTEARIARERMLGVIADGAFNPVFQPIVDLESGEIVGYEALTRFTDGVAPDVRFAAAGAIGLGIELESATLEAAIAAEETLPPNGWLNLNVSPELLLASKPLATILRGARRRIVLEVTEHAAISDYAALRAAVADLGPNVELAIDDAGSGYASLRHVVELGASFVKLDRSLVAALDSDKSRQAMIAGLVHFSLLTDCQILAEGIETEAELATLRSLGVPLGQGYLLGRPMPAVGESNG